MLSDHKSIRLFRISNHIQKRVFNRLKNLVGEGPSSFYQDACALMDLDEPFPTTTHLVSHLLRDIESALRDVLEPFSDRGKDKSHREEILTVLQALEIPEDDPIAIKWFDVIGKKNVRALHARAHRSNLGPPRPLDNEFNQFWLNMENIFDSILDRFESHYSLIQKKLIDLKEIEAPNGDDAIYLKDHVPNNIVAFRYLFEDLDNPSWLKPLHEEGFFDNPPEPVQHEEGGISFPPWPQSHYLLKMASREPEFVSKILSGIETTNSIVQEDLIDATCQLPPNIATRHAEKIGKWLENPFLIERKAGNLISYLANASETKGAAILTKEFLRFNTGQFRDRAQTDETAVYKVEPNSKVESWEYSQFLKNNFPDFMKASPRDALSIAFNALEEVLKLSDRSNKEDYRDYSEIWRPAIEDHEQNRGVEEPRDSLVSAVRNTSQYCIQKDPHSLEEIISEIEERRWTIFKRIALHLIRVFGNDNLHIVENHVLNREMFNYYPAHHEFVHLLQDFYTKFSNKKQSIVLEWIEEGPSVPGKEKIEQIDIDIWQLRWLTVLQGKLPPRWEIRRKKLVKKYKAPEKPDFLAWSSDVMTGPSSPLTVQQINTMSIDEFIAYINNWKAPPEFTMDSPEGISRTLATAIKDNPARFADDAEKFEACDPTYVHGLFDGLTQALKQERSFDWHPVIKLMNWVVQQDREIPGRHNSKSWDIDPDWGWTRTEISRLLESGCNSNRNQIPYDLNDAVWNVLLPLIDDPDPKNEDEADKDSDPATRSLNTTRGTAFHTLISYALWEKRNILKNKTIKDEDVDFKNYMPNVVEVLEKHLDKDYDPSPTIRAVYGMLFSNLAYLDRKWAMANAKRIFPKNQDERRYWYAAWNSFIGFNHPRKYLLHDLYDEYLFSTSMLDVKPPKSTWGNNPNERLVEHLLIYYAWKDIELDSELMQYFWGKATPDLRSHAIDFIGRSDKDATSEVILRFKKLWEYRFKKIEAIEEKSPYIDELKAFGWVFFSGNYNDEWCLDQLDKVLHIVGEIDYDHGVVERLASLSDKYPLKIVRLLQTLVEGEKRGWGPMLWTQDINVILSKALSSYDINAQKAAKELINRFASRGYPDFETLIK